MLNFDFQFAQLNTNQHVNIQTSFLHLVGCKNFGKNIQQKFSQNIQQKYSAKNIQQKFSQYIQQKYSDQPSTPCRLQKEQKAWQESLRGVSGQQDNKTFHLKIEFQFILSAQTGKAGGHFGQRCIGAIDPNFEKWILCDICRCNGWCWVRGRWGRMLRLWKRWEATFFFTTFLFHLLLCYHSK